MNPMNIAVWKTSEVKPFAGHMQPATLNVQITEVINGKDYTAKRVRTIHCAITHEEQGEIIEEMANECRIENRMNAKLDT